MNPTLVRARAYWDARSARERALLAAGAAVILMGIGYGLVFEPLRQANQKLAASLPKQRAEWRLAQAQVAEIEYLRAKARPAPEAGGGLLHTVESAAAAHNLRESLTSLTPLPPDRVRVVTSEMPTSSWIAWLDELEQQGVSIVSLTIKAGGRNGVASLEATFGGGQP